MMYYKFNFFCIPLDYFPLPSPNGYADLWSSNSISLYTNQNCFLELNDFWKSINPLFPMCKDRMKNRLYTLEIKGQYKILCTGYFYDLDILKFSAESEEKKNILPLKKPQTNQVSLFICLSSEEISSFERASKELIRNIIFNSLNERIPKAFPILVDLNNKKVIKIEAEFTKNTRVFKI